MVDVVIFYGSNNYWDFSKQKFDAVHEGLKWGNKTMSKTTRIGSG